MPTVGRNALGNEEIVAFLILCIPFSLFAHMDCGDPGPPAGSARRLVPGHRPGPAAGTSLRYI